MKHAAGHGSQAFEEALREETPDGREHPVTARRVVRDRGRGRTFYRRRCFHAALQLLGDFLLYRGWWIAGDLSRIVGLAAMNLVIILFSAWVWVSGNEGWFWYMMLVILFLGWALRRRDHRSVR